MKIVKKLILAFSIGVVSLLVQGCATPQATWKSLPEVTQNSHEQSWAIIVNVVTDKYNLEMNDINQGYLKSSWKESTGLALMWRTRVNLRVESKKPLKYQVKIEREYQDSKGHWYAQGTDKKIEDALIKEITEKLK